MNIKWAAAPVSILYFAIRKFIHYMNYSNIRKRKLVSSKDNAKRNHELALGSE